MKSIDEVLDSISDTLKYTDPNKEPVQKADLEPKWSLSRSLVTSKPIDLVSFNIDFIDNTHDIIIELDGLHKDTNAFYAIIYYIGRYFAEYYEGMKESEYSIEFGKRYALALENCIPFSVGHPMYKMNTIDDYERNRFERQRDSFPDDFVSFLNYATSFRNVFLNVKIVGYIHQNKKRILDYVSRRCTRISFYFSEY